MVAARPNGLLVPALAGCLLGAASVVAVSALSGLVPLDAVAQEALGGVGGVGVDGSQVVEASTAPPPFTVDPEAVATALAGGEAGPGRAEGEAASAGAAGAIDAVRRHRKARSPRPRPASARPDGSRQVPVARVSPPSVTLVLERNRRGRLVTVEVIDPSRAASRTLLTRRTTGQPKASSGTSEAGTSEAGKGDPERTWRRGTVAVP